MKEILFIKDSNNEVGFDVLCQYCAAIQERAGNAVMVLPIWPSGEVELVGDKENMKLMIQELKEVIDDLDIKLNE